MDLLLASRSPDDAIEDLMEAEPRIFSLESKINYLYLLRKLLTNPRLLDKRTRERCILVLLTKTRWNPEILIRAFDTDMPQIVQGHQDWEYEELKESPYVYALGILLNNDSTSSDVARSFLNAQLLLSNSDVGIALNFLPLLRKNPEISRTSEISRIGDLSNHPTAVFWLMQTVLRYKRGLLDYQIDETSSLLSDFRRFYLLIGYFKSEGEKAGARAELIDEMREMSFSEDVINENVAAAPRDFSVAVQRASVESLRKTVFPIYGVYYLGFVSSSLGRQMTREMTANLSPESQKDPLSEEFLSVFREMYLA